MIKCEAEFDAEFYLEQYPDIRGSGADPHAHYLRYGRAEGRFACALQREQVLAAATQDPDFDADFYLLHNPDVRASGMAAYEHFVLRGKREGRLGKAPAPSAEEGPQLDFDAEFYLRQYPDVRRSGSDPYQHFLFFGRAEGRLGVPPDADHAADPLAEFENSAEALLEFDEEYYLREYPDVGRSGMQPQLHFLRYGLAEGRFACALQRDRVRAAAAEDPDFDADFYLLHNPDVRASGMTPYEHFVLFGKPEGRLGKARAPSAEEGPQLDFDAEFYLRQYPDIRRSGSDPYQHFLVFGRAEGRLGVPPDADDDVDPLAEFENSAEALLEFDEEYYLREYPDVGRSGMQPHLHFLRYGHLEGRLGAKPELKKVEGNIPFDDAKRTVLVVSHEASVTGAPILSLNLVRGLQQRYNVVALLLGGGPLIPAFRESCVQLIGPLLQRQNASLAKDAIARLTELHDFEFAIVNSIESALVLEPLARHSVPAVVLIHEFASYTRPKWAFKTAFFWASEVVFSTQMTYDDVVSTYPQLRGRSCQFIAQGRCVLLAEELDEESFAAEMTHVRSVLRPPGLAEDTMVVIGIGSVHIRKGVELFIECAAKVVKANAGRPCRFVWIGKGFDPENDLSYSSYLADQIQRSGLQGILHFMDNTPLVEEVYKLSDMLLLTSRLDPLPGVAIEAMSHSLPVICFDRTTGIADVLTEYGMAAECVVPYLDTVAMAAQVLKYANSKALCEDVGRRLKPIVDEYFDMDRYVRALEALGLAGAAKVEQELQLAQQVFQTERSRADFLANAPVKDHLELVRWKYVRPWTAGFDRRKAFPGFHPGIYNQLRTDSTGIDPVLHFLGAGSPVGPWLHEVIGSQEPALEVPPTVRVALHLHVYYPELLPEMIERLVDNLLRPDLFISVPNAEVEARVHALLQATPALHGAAVVEIVPNRGRDIAPLLTGFGARLLDGYDIVGHLHTKKTADIADVSMSDAWRNFLFENLLGGSARMVDIIVGRMAADPSIGMVFPDEPNLLDWGNNRMHAQALCRKLGLSDTLPEHFEFPVGTMFWARVEALRPLFDLGLDWADYPAEPLPYDGSMLHAMERLLPLVVAHQGQRCVLTNVLGVTR